LQSTIWTKRSILFLAWLTLMVGFEYIFQIFQFRATPWIVEHDNIIHHTGASPDVYRMLIPQSARLVEALIEHLHPMSHHTALIAAYCGIQAIAIVFSLTMLYRLFREMFPEWLSLLGIMIVSLSMLVAYQEVQPWSLLDPGIYALGMLLALRRSTWALIPLIAIATLNRETACFLVVLLALALYRDADKVGSAMWAGIYSLVWAAFFFGIRHHVGSHPHAYTVTEYLQGNLGAGIILTCLKAFLFLGPLWALIPYSWSTVPKPVRHAAFAFPIFLVGAAPFSLWWETRLWTPFYCVLIPPMLYGLERLLRRERIVSGPFPASTERQDESTLDSDRSGRWPPVSCSPSH
jgi:hypothetical protein